MTSRVLYLDSLSSWIFDPEMRADLCVYAIQQGILEVIMYTGGPADIRILYKTAANPTRTDHSATLKLLVDELKACGLQKFRVAVGSNEEVERARYFHNNSSTITGIALEYEWWNNSPRDFSSGMAVLDYTRDVMPTWNLGCYIGWLQANANLALDEYHQLTQHADTIYIHSYNDNPSKSFNYAKNRLTEFGRCSTKTPIVPLLSTEWRDDSTGAHVICDAGPTPPGGSAEYYNRMCFMGKWLETHSLSEAETIYRNNYNAWAGKNTVNLADEFAYFAWTHTKLNSGWTRIPVSMYQTSGSTASQANLRIQTSVRVTENSISSCPTVLLNNRKMLTFSRESGSTASLASLMIRKNCSVGINSNSEISSSSLSIHHDISCSLNSQSYTSTPGLGVSEQEKYLNCSIVSESETSSPILNLEKWLFVDKTSESSSLPATVDIGNFRYIEFAVISQSSCQIAELQSNNSRINLSLNIQSESISVAVPLFIRKKCSFSGKSYSTYDSDFLLWDDDATPLVWDLLETQETLVPIEFYTVEIQKWASLSITKSSQSVGSVASILIQKSLSLTKSSSSTAPSSILFRSCRLSLSAPSTSECTIAPLSYQNELFCHIQSRSSSSSPPILIQKSLSFNPVSISTSAPGILFRSCRLSLSCSSESVVECYDDAILIQKYLRTHGLSSSASSTPNCSVIRNVELSRSSESTSRSAEITLARPLTVNIQSHSFCYDAVLGVQGMFLELDLQSKSETISCEIQIQKNVSLERESRSWSNPGTIVVGRNCYLTLNGLSEGSIAEINLRKPITLSKTSGSESSISSYSLEKSCSMIADSRSSAAACRLLNGEPWVCEMISESTSPVVALRNRQNISINISSISSGSASELLNERWITFNKTSQSSVSQSPINRLIYVDMNIQSDSMLVSPILNHHNLSSLVPRARSL